MERRDDKVPDGVDTIKADTHDVFDEAKERIAAGGEKAKRAVEGDSMPLGERVGSHAKELGHELKAEFDKAKRETRDERS
jgi:hypothetical protein